MVTPGASSRPASAQAPPGETEGLAGQRRRLASLEARLPPLVGDPTTRRILGAALRLFAERGFHASSMREIADASSTSMGAIYGRFPQKELILAELVWLANEGVRRELTSAVDGAGEEPTAQLRAFMRSLVLAHAEYPMMAIVSNDEFHVLPLELMDRALVARSRCEELVTGVLRAGIESGAFAVDHMTATIAAFSSMGIRVASWYSAETSDLTASELADLFAEMALRMVTPSR